MESKKDFSQMPNGQVQQKTQDLPPVEGSEGYIGAETGPALGMNVVQGKKGYSTNKPIWEQQSSRMGLTENTGSQDGDAEFGGQDDTDEYATYKKPQTDEGLPQTFRDSEGAGDAGSEGADEMSRDTDGSPDTQSTPSDDAGDHSMGDMPQTEYTHNTGGGAPLFKHKG